ncbi:uncharacterized protein CC84DRAFT_1197684 [Paraphaeosphaeria sporulosa]|uniref:Metallo-beta-lactamase domain-containing protein n=1 Tax=Paraphaeosphaeria sporulosa TaxID=1460663 RepID=A0A177CBU5_9PLEO|nr:uncharacterized protein CC84DRAFT_1197684 [Paraphaeosphaeria sporulosa]OAG04228.1 hypothetical protein CC84DRAFT_1197684 [Paraphaeosphaeria sporulosa]
MRHTFISSVIGRTTSASAQNIAVSTYAPLPSNASSPPINKSTSYRLETFMEGICMVTDGIYYNIFFVKCCSVIVIDAPPTIGTNLLRAICNITSLPISQVMYSHSHIGHIGGAFFSSSSFGSLKIDTFIGHNETAERFAAVQDYQHQPYPTVTFSDLYTLNVCNQTLQLDYLGLNHEPGNIVTYAPYQKVFTPREYVQDLFNTCLAALTASGQPDDNGTNTLSNEVTLRGVVKANPNNAWREGVVNETIGQWNDALYDMNVYGLSHAQTLSEAVRVDWGIQRPYGVVN